MQEQILNLDSINKTIANPLWTYQLLTTLRTLDWSQAFPAQKSRTGFTKINSNIPWELGWIQWGRWSWSVRALFRRMPWQLEQLQHCPDATLNTTTIPQVSRQKWPLRWFRYAHSHSEGELEYETVVRSNSLSNSELLERIFKDSFLTCLCPWVVSISRESCTSWIWNCSLELETTTSCPIDAVSQTVLGRRRGGSTGHRMPQCEILFSFQYTIGRWAMIQWTDHSSLIGDLQDDLGTWSNLGYG